jgi:hypothetical protein
VSCLFCDLPEPNYQPDTGVDFICGFCVILLANVDQEDLKRTYQKALNKAIVGYFSGFPSVTFFMIFNNTISFMGKD